MYLLEQDGEIEIFYHKFSLLSLFEIHLHYKKDATLLKMQILIPENRNVPGPFFGP